MLLPQTIESLTSRHRTGMMDATFRHYIDWGLGFIIDSKHYHQATLPYRLGFMYLVADLWAFGKSIQLSFRRS